jgi:hypothetical protein
MRKKMGACTCIVSHDGEEAWVGYFIRYGTDMLPEYLGMVAVQIVITVHPGIAWRAGSLARRGRHPRASGLLALPEVQCYRTVRSGYKRRESSGSETTNRWVEACGRVGRDTDAAGTGCRGFEAARRMDADGAGGGSWIEAEATPASAWRLPDAVVGHPSVWVWQYCIRIAVLKDWIVPWRLSTNGTTTSHCSWDGERDIDARRGRRWA